jgi:hypothetical protein
MIRLEIKPVLAFCLKIGLVAHCLISALTFYGMIFSILEYLKREALSTAIRQQFMD